MCVVVPFILGLRLVDAPAGVTHGEGHTGFLHLPSAVLALIFIARRIQPPLSLVDCEVEFCYLKKNLNASRPSEHPQSGRIYVKTFMWDHRLAKTKLLHDI